jgi:hypothetical protein
MPTVCGVKSVTLHSRWWCAVSGSKLRSRAVTCRFLPLCARSTVSLRSWPGRRRTGLTRVAGVWVMVLDAPQAKSGEADMSAFHTTAEHLAGVHIAATV